MTIYNIYKENCCCCCGNMLVFPTNTCHHFEISAQKLGKSVRLVRDQGFHSLITCPSGINLFETPDQYIFNKLILLPEKTT